jgi:hypothetical protein
VSKAGDIFIVDNSDSDWRVRSYLLEWCDLSRAMDIATGYFEIGALLALDDKWQAVEKIRILMGDEVSMRTKRAFADGLKRINGRLDVGSENEKWLFGNSRGRLSGTALAAYAETKSNSRTSFTSYLSKHSALRRLIHSGRCGFCHCHSGC